MALTSRAGFPDELVEAQEMEDALWEGPDRLAPELRRVVVLRYLEGCGLREIASFFAVPWATGRWRLRKAERRLREERAVTSHMSRLWRR